MRMGGWNRGLTAKTDKRIARNSESTKETFRLRSIQNKEKVRKLLSSDINREKAFSYLVGFWIGDGLKTTGRFSFAIKGDKIPINSIVEKVSLIFGRSVKYYHKSMILWFYKDVKALQDVIVEELSEKRIIKAHPWHFLAGFLDSDGWVYELPGIGIVVGNSNMDYLLLLGEILSDNLIPYRFEYRKTKRNEKPFWSVITRTIASTYVVAHKVSGITADKTKRQRLKDYMEFFEEKYLNQVLPICETFTSIQGEGTNAGAVQFFIRAATCDMKCKICDSKYSWGKGEHRSIQQLLDDVSASGIMNVCLTGGEIAQFKGKLAALVAFLRVRGIHIVLQTNGLHYHIDFDLIHTVGMDMKTPSTGEKSNESLILKLGPKDEVKTLIHDMVDYEYAVKINKIVRGVGCRQILQPLNLVGEDTIGDLLDKYRWICEMVVKDRRWGSNIRVIPQLHVFLWGNKRGV
jgi:7-carboxy-7-deazaguanine synthase